MEARSQDCYRPDPSWTDSALLTASHVLTHLSRGSAQTLRAGLVLTDEKWGPREVE